MSTTSESDGAYGLDDEGSYWRSPKTVLAALVLIAIVAAGIWVISDDPAPTAAGGPAAAQQQGAPAAVPTLVPSLSDATYDSACGLIGGSTQVPTETPTGTEWQNIDGWSLPVNAQQGPGKRSDSGPSSCFARTPTGALLAAYTIAADLGRVDDHETVVKQQTAPGVGQSALLDEGRGTLASPHPVPLGFVVESYTRDDATITVYLNSTQIGEYSCSTRVQWFGGAAGDWRIRLEPDGSTTSGCIKGAPARYVPWGPANV